MPMVQRFWVVAKPNARRAAVTKLSDNEFQVAVTAPAQDGRANAALIELLAVYFGLPKSRIQIVSGTRARRKLVAIS